MGLVQREMERQEDLRSEATEIAIEAGVLRRCRYHEDIVMDAYGDRIAAYKLANYRYPSGTLDYRSRRELTDAIKDVIEQSGDDCPFCEKWKKGLK